MTASKTATALFLYTRAIGSLSVGVLGVVLGTVLLGRSTTFAFGVFFLGMGSVILSVAPLLWRAAKRLLNTMPAAPRPVIAALIAGGASSASAAIVEGAIGEFRLALALMAFSAAVMFLAWRSGA